jgi:hypothetical protein
MFSDGADDDAANNGDIGPRTWSAHEMDKEGHILE